MDANCIVGRTRGPGARILAVMLALLMSQVVAFAWASVAEAAGTYANLVANNKNYSLEGAVYYIYDNASCTSDHKIGELVTDSTGKCKSEKLDPGTYYVKEYSASRGYILSDEVKPVVVKGGQTSSFTMDEVPCLKDPDIALVKVDEHSSDGLAVGDNSIAGAQYRVRHYNGSDATSDRGSCDADAVFETDEDGHLRFRLGTPVSGTWAFRDGNVNVLPLGVVTVQEISSSTGYVVDTTEYSANVKQVASGSDRVRLEPVVWPSDGRVEVAGSDEAVVSKEKSENPIVLVEKLEHRPENREMVKTSVTEGLARIAGTKFRVTNLSNQKVWVDGREYQPNEEIDKDYVSVMITADLGAKYGEEYVGHAMAIIDDLPSGKYRIRESQPPIGHLPNTDWSREFTIEAYASDGQETPKVGTVLWEEDAVDNYDIRGGIAVTKMDYDLRTAQPQGNGSLRGFEYTITLDAEAGDGEPVNSPVWVAGGLKGEGRTDAQGNHFEDKNFYKYEPGEDVTIIVTNDRGFAATPKRQLPYARYVVKETKAAPSYILGSKWKARILVDEEDVLEHTDVYNKIKRGGVKVQKWDEELKRIEPQGDATFAGAEFEITNRCSADQPSEGIVVVDGKQYKPGEVVMTITTDENGYAITKLTETNEDGEQVETTAVLPYGSYTIRETKAPEGYELNGEWFRDFDITEQGMVVDYTKVEDGTPEKVIRGGVKIGKVDAETGAYNPLGAASLEGAKFSITNDSVHSVNVDDTVFAPGAVVKTISTVYDEESGRYVASTDEDSLPYGTYTLREIEASEGYYVNKGWSKQFSIREKGFVDFTEPEDAVPNQVMREDFHFQKKDDPEMGAMANVVFRITSDTTGESHIIVTDENGTYHSISTWNRHEIDTNANDDAVTFNEDGTYTIDEDALNPKAGTWFYGSSDDTSNAPDDRLRAFPYDSYTMEELRCAGNEGHKLVTVQVILKRGNDYPVWVDAHEGFTGYDLDYGTIDNQTVRINTIATHDNGHVVPAVEHGTMVDTVVYMNLDDAHEYVMKGTVYLLDEDGNATTEVARGETTFTTMSSHGTVDVAFDFDTREYAGQQLVVYEELYDGTDRLAKHIDSMDENQRVTIPEIETELEDVEGAKETDASAKTITLVDHVAYKGLEQGGAYTMTAMLHVRDAEGNDAGVATDANGAPIVAIQPFVAEAAEGTVDVTFTFVAPNLAGQTVVAFEELKKGDETYAVHFDINDDNQTVTFPKLITTAKSADTDDHVAAAGNIVVHDTIAYENMIVGREYRVEGRLMCVGIDETGARVELGFATDDNGNEIVAETTFTPEQPSGEVAVDFEFAGVKSAGKTFVIYEQGFYGDKRIASEEDAESEDQSVYVPEIGTTATAHDSDSDDVLAGRSVQVDDVVKYTNLLPGREYTIKGELVLVNERFADKQVEGVLARATTTFTPETPDGEVTLTFDVDTHDLGGRKVVAFEDLYLGNVLLRSHADLEDEAQTVRIPEIYTTFVESEDGTHVALPSEETVLVDTLTYHNLTPGATYVAIGRLMDKATGAPVTDAEGNVVFAQTTFSPEESDGSVELTFTFDTTGFGGKSVVAFERVTRNDYVVAVHEDITDEDQTVHFPDAKTNLGCGTDRKILVGDQCESLVDTITYTNLVRGLTYEVTGVLHVADYDENGVLVDEGPLLDSKGQPVTKTKSFVPQYSDGEVSLVFDCDTRDLIGKKLVAFERITLDGRDVVVHEDINDKDQTVMYPEIKTELTNGGSHAAVPSENSHFVDSVAYKNLIPGETFTLVGQLVDGETGEEIGEAVVFEFVPEAESGYVDVEFDVDTSELAGRTIVAFETLQYCGEDYAHHEDLDDPSQTISFPTISTSAAAGDAEHDQLALSDKATVVDVVTYEGLVPGETYTIEGTLMSRASGAAVADEGAFVSAAFTPEDASGTFPMLFTIDSTRLVGDTLVVFESVKFGDTIVAEHADIEDDEQAVYVADIETVLTNLEGDAKSINPARDGKAKDTIHYSNLVAGKSYHVEGKLVSAYNEETVFAEAERDFTPAESNGSVEVEFEASFAHLKDETIVAFERLYDSDGRLVAVHEDLYDEDQRAQVTDKVTPFDPWIRTNLYALCESKAADPVVQNVIDRISYMNLEIGKSYVVESELHAYGKDDEDLGVVVEQSNTFDCITTTGTFEVVFEDVDLSKYPEARIVAFERVYVEGEDANGECTLCEEDLHNECQTIRVNRDPEKTPADIKVEKFANPVSGSKVGKDDRITYTIRVSNEGETAGTITVQDVIPEGTSLVEDSINLGGRIDRAFWILGEPLSVTWLDVSVGGEDFVDLTFTVRVNGDVADIDNVALWTDEDGEQHESNHVTHHVEQIVEHADLVAVKSVVDPGAGVVVSAGDAITYRIAVTNRGNVAATTTVTDYAPTGSTIDPEGVGEGGKAFSLVETPLDLIPGLGDYDGVVFEGVTVEPGATVNCEFRVIVDEDAAGVVTSIDNVATYVDEDDELVETNHVENPVDEPFTPDPDPDPVDGVKAVKSAYPRNGEIVAVGDTITYHLNFKNTNDHAVHGLGVYDAIPAGTEYIKNSSHALIDGEDVTVEPIVDAKGIGEMLTELPAGSEAELTFQVKVVESALETRLVENFATWQLNCAKVPTSALKYKTNVVTHRLVEPEADIMVIKAADVDKAKVGDTITYTLTAVNTGDLDGTVSVHDLIPEGSTLVEDSVSEGGIIERTFWVLGNPVAVRWDDVTVPAGGTITMSFAVTVNEGVDLVSNEATYETGDREDKTNKVDVPIEHEIPEDPTVVKSVDKTKAKPGDELIYTITITNNDSVERDVYVVDGNVEGLEAWDAESAEVTCDHEGFEVTYGDESGISVVGKLAAGETAKITLKSKIVDDFEGTVENFAQYRFSADVDYDKTNKVTTVVEKDEPQPEGIVVTKSADPESGSYVSAGETITYKIRFENKGDENVRGLGIYDVIPDGVAYVSDSARVSMDGEDVTTDHIYEADAIGELLTNLPAGHVAELTFDVVVSEDAPDRIVNVATWATDVEAVPTSALSNVTNEVYHLLEKQGANIESIKVANPATGSNVKVGDVVSYDVSFVNAGKDVDDFGFFDAIPAGTILVDDSVSVMLDEDDVTEATATVTEDAVSGVIPSLGANSVVTLHFDVMVTEAVDATFTNVASWDVDVDETPSEQLANLTNETVHLVSDKVDVTPVKAVDKSEAKAGETLMYAITITNNGARPLHHIGLYDAIPAQTSYVSGSKYAIIDGEDVTFAEEPSTVSNVTGDFSLAPGSTMVCGFSVRIADDATGTIVNSARWGIMVEGDIPSENLPNLTNEVRTKIPTPEPEPEPEPTPADIVLKKSVDKTSAKAGDTLTYTISYENRGEAAGSLVISDNVPGNVTLVKGSYDGATLDNGVLTWNVGSVKGGAKGSVSFKATINKGTTGTVANVAVGVVDGGDPEPSNKVTTKINKAKGSVDLKATKSVTDSKGMNLADGKNHSLKANDVLTYKIVVTNKGEADAANIGFYDAIPSGTTYVAKSLDVKLNGKTPVGFSTDGDTVENASSIKDINLKSLGTLRAGGKDKLVITFKVALTNSASGSIRNVASVDAGVTALPTGELGVKSNEVVVKLAAKDSTKTTDSAKSADQANLKTGVDSAIVPVMATTVLATAGAFVMAWRRRKNVA